MEQDKISRYSTLSDYEQMVPLFVVWEITLACNLKCSHCGSRAGKVRPDELDLDECRSIIEQLKKLGTREIALIGGEAFLKRDWLKIVEKITEEGMDCSMQTGAFNFTEEKILQAKAAGIKNVGVSIDGLADTHNALRGREGSYDHAIRCLTILKKHSIPSSVNTTVTNFNKNRLPELSDILVSCGVKNWQIQIAVAMGNAVDNDGLILQPADVKDVIDIIAGLYVPLLAKGMLIQPGNNIGYFGPHEHIWRGGNFGYFAGCSAGHTSMGIEADGTIKGCPSLPTKDYTGGNVRDLSLKDIWENSEEIAFTRKRNTSDLWGFCKTCYYSSVCLAGCTWTGHVLFGQRGNNPFCYHRVSELEKAGKREKIRKIKSAGGQPFDYGLFEIVVEDREGNELEIQKYDKEAATDGVALRTVGGLHLCKNCKNYVYEDTEICPFCNTGIREAEDEYNSCLKEASDALARLSALNIL